MRSHDLDPAQPLASRPAVAGRRAAARQNHPRGFGEGYSGGLDAAAISHLQRTAGNASVSRLIDKEPISPVLGVLEDDLGQPLDTGVRSIMESRMGQDFGDVRVHTGAQASESARTIEAQAYTVGTDVVFQAGTYEPGTAAGQHVIAHELTHVMQQKAGPVAGTPAAGGVSISDPSDVFELAAELNAGVVTSMAGPGAGPTGAPATAPVSAQRQQEEEELDAEVQPMVAQRQGEGEEPAATGEEEASASGSAPDVATPEGEGRESGTEMEEAADTPTPSGPGNVTADISVSSSPSQPRTDRIEGKLDSVVSGLSVGTFSQPGGKAVSPFGGESYEPKFTGVSYAFAGGNCTISAKLDPVCPWGTNAGGHTDVPSASDAVVTLDTWKDVKSDLTPGADSPHKSPRNTYYSQAMVERHEQFHGTDDLGWTNSSGLGIAMASVEGGTVAKATADADVTALLDAARTKLIAENLVWYKGGGASHDQFAGEIRAYADGQPSYQALVEAVATRAAIEQWSNPPPASPPGTEIA